MFRSVLAVAAIAAFTSPSFAGQAVFTATGTVGSGSAGSGPFAGTPVGSAVTLKFEVNVPGAPATASSTNYTIDQPTFLLTMGANSTGLNSASSTCAMYNADPLIDRIILGSAPLVGGGSVSFSFTDINGSTFNSQNPLTNVGSWSGNFYSVYSFSVQGPGMFFDINFQTFSISLSSTGTPTCFGDGSGTACPCGNNSIPGASSGCLSSIGLGGKLLGTGASSIGADTLALNASQVPNGPGLFFQASALASGGAGFSFGDGILCGSGSIVRLGVVFAAGNASSYPGGSTPGPISVGGGCVPGDVRYYQVWYRDADTTYCTSAVFNLTNALSVTWGS